MSHPKSKPSFDAGDFDEYQWMEILEQVNPKLCQNYSEKFRAEAEAYRLSGNALGQEIFQFLSRITSILMCPTELELTATTQELVIEILPDHYLTVLRDLVTTVSDPELQARIADILWVCKRDPEKTRPIQMARVAVESYVKAAKTLEDTGDWMICHERLQRAAQLALLIDGKKDTAMRCMIVSHIEQLVDRYTDVEDEFMTGGAMKVLQEDLRKSLSSIQNDLPNYATRYATIAGKKAVSINSSRDYHRAFCSKMAYRQIEGEWYKIAGDKEAERNAKLQLVEIEIWYAQQALVANEVNPYAVAAGRLKSAIAALRKIEDTFGRRQDTSNRIQALHKQILGYQKEAIAQMVTISIAESNDFNDSEMQEAARELVKGKSLQEALYLLAFGTNLICSLEDLQVAAKRDIENNTLSHLIPTSFVDDEGKTKAKNSDGADDLENTMLRIVSFYQGWYGFNFIAPACNQISSEHNVKLEDLSFVVVQNPFIPEERETLYVRGLLAGLREDPVVAAHLLIPQLENSLRYILKQNGFIASNLTSTMIQDEYTLNKVLDLPELKQILTEKMVFTLKSLLVERMGSNLRNEICHGLLNYNQLLMPQVLYLWWLTLHLCLIPSFKAWLENQDQ